MKNLKKELRDQIRQKRRGLSPEERERKSGEICQNLLQDLSSREVGKLFSYLALKEEPNLQDAIDQARKLGWEIYIPAVTAPTVMKAALYEGELVKTELGFLQPKDLIFTSVEEIDLFWIPGVAFDSEGFRMGMGGGFYDRFLEGIVGEFIGIGWDFQMNYSIPKESHDIQMTKLVSNAGLTQVSL